MVLSTHLSRLLLSSSTCLTLCNPTEFSTPGSPVLHYLLLRFMSIESVMLSNFLILCCPLLLLPSSFPNIRVFSNELGGQNICSFNFSISPSNKYSGLISFRMDWLDLLTVQGTLQESSPAPQFKSINSSTLSLVYDPTLSHTHTWSLDKL